jgi:peptidoglycan L-alanyl-D-glutamate endopeptidase CwlK
MSFVLGRRSIQKLDGVHDDLVQVVHKAITLSTVDFTVLEGVRSPDRQRELLKIGATRTMNSRHLTGHAVDLGAWVEGKVAWDWPLYYKIADAMKSAAVLENVEIEWGGDWTTFKDGPHFQLSWADYPK